MCALEAQVSGLYTIISDKVSAETKCSKYFSRLSLHVDEWKSQILNIDCSTDRDNRDAFLDIAKASSANMANEFRKIYED